MEQKKRIVVFHQGALGDFLLVVPLLEALYRATPGIRFSFFSKRSHVSLLSEKPYLDSVHQFDEASISAFYHESLWRHYPVPNFFLNSDTVLIFGQSGTRRLAEHLERRLPCPVHYICSFPDAEYGEHAYDFLVSQIRALGWPLYEDDLTITPPRSELKFVREDLIKHGAGDGKKSILIHPGSGGLRKVWPAGKWLALFEWILENTTHQLLITLGPADEKLKGLAFEAKKIGARILENLTLPRLTAYLALCHRYFGSDSGVSHLAAAVGIPSMVFFGPTDPRVWRPRGKRVCVVKDHWQLSEVLDRSNKPTRWKVGSPHHQALRRFFLEECLELDFWNQIMQWQQ